MSISPGLAEVAEFVREYVGVGPRVAMGGSTLIEAHLGVTGDDGYELLSAAEEEFVADFGDDLRVSFGLGPEEVLFGPEGVGLPGIGRVYRWLRGRAPVRVKDLTVAELHEAIVHCSTPGPIPPFLVIRPGTAFWVEHEPHSRVRATLQAFREGCYEGVDFIDKDGGAWAVAESILRGAPSLFAWMTPARLLRVKVRLGPQGAAVLRDTVGRLDGILRSDSDFTGYLKTPPERLAALLQECESFSDVIQVVETRAS